MRIAHLAGWYFPDGVGGTEIYVRELCRHQREAGHTVTVAAPRAGLGGAELTEHDHVPVFRYPIPSAPTRDEAQGTGRVRGADQLGAWLARWRPDVVHVHSFVTGLGLDEIDVARRLGARIVVTHHLPSLGYLCRRGTLMENGHSACDGIVSPRRCAACVLDQRGIPRFVAGAAAIIPAPLSRAAGRLPGRAATVLGLAASIAHDQARQHRLFAAADVQVVLNETARHMFVANRLPVDRLVVNRLGISGGPYRRKSAAPTRKPVTFGSLSRFHEIKGLFELVRAARRIDPAVPFRVDIRGPIRNDADRQFAAALTRAAAGDPRIVVEAGPAHADVPALLASYDVLCSVGTSFENGPTVALEAMAVGTPLLATRVGNQAEIVRDGENGRLVPPGDEGALAAAIALLAADPEPIDRWRLSLPPIRTMRDVAAEYDVIYARLAAQSAA